MSLRKTFLTLFFVTLLSSCAYHQQHINSYIENPEHEVVLTSGLNHRKEAINSLTEVSMDIEELYLFVNWINIPRFKFDFRYMLYDAQGTLVALSNFEGQRKPNWHDYRTWLVHVFDAEKETPGIWNLELYLNDKIVSKKSFKVNRH